MNCGVGLRLGRDPGLRGRGKRPAAKVPPRNPPYAEGEAKKNKKKKKKKKRERKGYLEVDNVYTEN